MGHEGRELRRRGWVVPLGLGLLLLGGTLLVKEPTPFVEPMGPLSAPPERGQDRLLRVELTGPRGSTVFPTGAPCVIHVWRQDCGDCAPAFEAAEELGVGPSRWDAPVYNVAFGPADLEVARSRGLDDGLVFDPLGTAVVRPLRIGTFTTLVVDAQGLVRHRDHPQRVGYVTRVSEALAQVRGSLPEATAPRAVVAIARPRPAEESGSGVTLFLIQLTAFVSVFVGCLWAGATVGLFRRRRAPGAAPLRRLGQELGLQAGQRCPYCHAGVGGFDWCVRCEGCGAAYHEECGRDLGTCSALGCGRTVASTRV